MVYVASSVISPNVTNELLRIVTVFLSALIVPINALTPKVPAPAVFVKVNKVAICESVIAEPSAFLIGRVKLITISLVVATFPSGRLVYAKVAVPAFSSFVVKFQVASEVIPVYTPGTTNPPKVAPVDLSRNEPSVINT